MKKKILLTLLAVSVVASLTACGKKEKDSIGEPVTIEVEAIEEESEVATEEEDTDVLPEGKVWSELSGLAVDKAIENQRPIAAMVDNEKTAYPHFGLNSADVIYEIMNSTANDHITRLMVVYKDWGNIEQLGSIRSVRPTNFMLAAEYNAVICHDGGPFYIDEYIAKDYSRNFSGVFSRVKNGKATEFTEYIVKGDLEKAFSKSKWTEEYDEYYEGPHFTFAPSASPITNEEGEAAENVDLSAAFGHTSSMLKYDAQTGLYTYWAYGSEHLDGKTKEPLTFKNVILQKTSYSQLDKNGYLIYNCICEDWDGYYITNGKAVKIKWSKLGEKDQTKYYLENGDEITLNKGMTYISLVPDDAWDDITLN